MPSAAHSAQPAPPLQATHLAAAPVPRMYQPLAQAVQRPGVEQTSQELSAEHCTRHGAHSRAGRQLLRLLRCEQALGSAQLAPRQKAREAPGSCYTAVAALCPLVVLTFTHLPLDTVNPLLHWVQPLAPHWRHPAGHCGGQVGG